MMQHQQDTRSTAPHPVTASAAYPVAPRPDPSEALPAQCREAAEQVRLHERIIASAANGVVILDVQQPDRPIIYCNDAFERTTGTTRREVVGRPVAFLCGTPPDPEVCRQVQSAIDRAAPCSVAIPYHPRDGALLWTELALSPVFDDTGTPTHYVGVQTDITQRLEVEAMLARKSEALEQANAELRQKQANLVHTEKMASLGQLAAGIAHEINNPIAFVLSNLSMLSDYVDTFIALLQAYAAHDAAVAAGDAAAQQRCRDEITALHDGEDLAFILEDVRLLVAESLTGGERVKEIVQSLKSFARLDEAEMKEADINEGLRATLRMLWNELKYTCTVTERLAPLPPIRCYPGQLNQVFMNLIMNAAQAIEGRGEITIETRVEEPHVVIRISDTGVGIPEAHLGQLFNPFFTTKPVGEGTGLGLSISYGIIRKHNGRIEVESREGQGTTFTILLPIDQEGDDEGDDS